MTIYAEYFYRGADGKLISGLGTDSVAVLDARLSRDNLIRQARAVMNMRSPIFGGFRIIRGERFDEKGKREAKGEIFCSFPKDSAKWWE